MTEEWRGVVGYEGLYSVSSLGNIKSFIGHHGVPVRGMSTRRLLKGYPGIKLCKVGAAKTATVHSIVAAAFIGPRPTGMEINHKNGVKTDNRVVNLEYMTRGENSQHAARMGLAYVGILNAAAKLAESDVRRIRSEYKPWVVSANTLARRFGVTKRSILNVVHRKTWSHIAC